MKLPGLLRVEEVAVARAQMRALTGFGDSGASLQRRLAFERLANASYGSVYERGFADVHQRAALYAKRVNDALAAAPALATGFPSNLPLATQLKTVAKMIAVRERLGMSRQIFFVGVGGFDTHDDQLIDQPRLLGDLSASLAAFHAATVELGVASNVTTFTQSDFGRTLTSNGDGSDHAWGGVQLERPRLYGLSGAWSRIRGFANPRPGTEFTRSAASRRGATGSGRPTSRRGRRSPASRA